MQQTMRWHMWQIQVAIKMINQRLKEEFEHEHLQLSSEFSHFWSTSPIKNMKIIVTRTRVVLFIIRCISMYASKSAVESLKSSAKVKANIAQDARKNIYWIIVLVNLLTNSTVLSKSTVVLIEFETIDCKSASPLVSPTCWNIKAIVNKENSMMADGTNGSVLSIALFALVMFWGGEVLFVWGLKGNADESVSAEVLM